MNVTWGVVGLPNKAGSLINIGGLVEGPPKTDLDPRCKLNWIGGIRTAR